VVLYVNDISIISMDGGVKQEQASPKFHLQRYVVDSAGTVLRAFRVAIALARCADVFADMLVAALLCIVVIHSDVSDA